jgi:hypothetical protein
MYHRPPSPGNQKNRAKTKEFVGLRSDKLLMQNRPHDDGSQ